jgi:hypothetical protein
LAVAILDLRQDARDVAHVMAPRHVLTPVIITPGASSYLMPEADAEGGRI